MLLVEDDVEIGRLVSGYLAGHGFAVEAAASGGELRRALETRAPDLVLLDLGLPDEDGLGLLQYLRQRWQGPVLVVSGRGEAVERVVGLELGADDYVTKPFDLRELLARIRSALRRSNGPAPPAPTRLRFAGLELDPGARRLGSEDGEEIPLTSGEFELLWALAGRPNQVLSRDALMNHLHGREAGPYDRAIDVAIARLRRKIERNPSAPALIRSVRGVGYLFAAEVRRS
ncbi:response regulator transcription factor [Luteimonas salinisoli]|uniref:response regulator transcription factor n=1 Tax=Luteimonas salinisoli TaxID=2752307 RepID=UPI0031F2F202